MPSLQGWTPAPFATKAEVDANYKAVLDILCAPEFDDGVRVGVASHNLFDVAWAIGLRNEMVAAGRPARIEFEMLEGMSPSQSDAVRAVTGDLLLYTPVVARRDFPAAIAYLVRRLDENTSPDNFLAHLFDLAADPAVFDREADGSSTRCRLATRSAVLRVDGRIDGRPRHRRHSTRTVRQRRGHRLDPCRQPSLDRRRPRGATRAAILWKSITINDVDAAVSTAVGAQDAWWALGARERAMIIDRVGDRFEEHRGRALAVMAAEAGKTIAQGDPEVSEAVDFARYYARRAPALERIDGASVSPRGTVVVTPPWNFPFAIPPAACSPAWPPGTP